MTQTTLRKVKDQGKFKLSKSSDVVYTKQTKWRRSSGLVAIVFTSDSSGRTFKRVGSVKVWLVEPPFNFRNLVSHIVNKSTGSTVARKQKK